MSFAAPDPVIARGADIAAAFVDALAGADFPRARRLLADRGFTYLGPTRSFDDPDAFIADISRIGTILKAIHRRHQFENGNAVCVICDVVTTLPDLEHTRVAMLFGFQGASIRSLEVFYDAHPYARMFPDPLPGEPSHD